MVTNGKVHVLDLAAKLDTTADFLAHSKWGKVDFPPPFGRDALPEEAFIADLDAKSGASLKITVLNAKGRIWTMVAGGGASVIYADTICDLGERNSKLCHFHEVARDLLKERLLLVSWLNAPPKRDILYSPLKWRVIIVTFKAKCATCTEYKGSPIKVG